MFLKGRLNSLRISPPHCCAECVPKRTQPPTPEASFAQVLTPEEVSTASPSQGGSAGSNRLPLDRGHDCGAENGCSHSPPSARGRKHSAGCSNLGLSDHDHTS